MASSLEKVVPTCEEVVELMQSDPEKCNWFTWQECQKGLSPRVALALFNSKCKIKELGMWEKIPSYEELDTVNLLKLLKHNYNKYMNDPVLRTLSITNGNDKTFKYSNKERMMKDISFLIKIETISLNNVQECRAEISLVMKWLKTKYCIDINVRPAGISLAPNVVTIPRMGACFPITICDYFHKGCGKPPFAFRDIGIASHSKLSKALFCTYMPALIPSSWINNPSPVHYLFFYVHVLTDAVMHIEDENFTDLDTMLTCYTASYRYAGTSEATREKWVKKIGLGDSTTKTFNIELVTAAIVCEYYIKITRANDKMLTKVLNDLQYLK